MGRGKKEILRAMSFEIVLRREAQIDLDETFVWYE